MYNGVTQ